jgi:hypothetical protein
MFKIHYFIARNPNPAYTALLKPIDLSKYKQVQSTNLHCIVGAPNFPRAPLKGATFQIPNTKIYGKRQQLWKI